MIKSLKKGVAATLLVAGPLAVLPAQAGPLDALFGGFFDTDSAHEKEAKGIAFSNALFEGYNQLSADVDFPSNGRDAELFNHKARAAGSRSAVQADSPMDRILDAGQVAEFEAALLEMNKMFDRGATVVAPDLAAEAQVSYDCWIEATEYRSSTAGDCKQRFDEAMAALDNVANFKLTEFAPYEVAVVEPAPVVEPFDPRSDAYLVFFNFDSTVATSSGRVSLDEALVAASENPNTTLRIVAHADRSGTVDYNQALSQRRLSIVMEAMADAGIDVGRIVSDAVGENQPLIPTEDGVREPGNRVVEIFIE
ncbi:OmpA family protein [Kiloniella sp. b19]|uniref:OmpA family protein n=1 Tax=Kiloniella sp. GXU_MW_B19 TaxID=3141326 RepID=UPI0031D5118D